MLDILIQGFALVVIAAAFYYAGRNRDYVVAKYPFFAFLPDWTRKSTP